MEPLERGYTAFVGVHRVATGDLEDVVRKSPAAREGREGERLILLQDATGAPFDIDSVAPPDEIVARLAWHPLVGAPRQEPPPERRGPGRPRLGVVSREVSLLPRHWEWLAGQRGGASAALRRLVDAARRDAERPDRVRRARDATYRVMAELAGDRPHFEEACRALFAGRWETFDGCIAEWPQDVRDHVVRMTAPAREG